MANHTDGKFDDKSSFHDHAKIDVDAAIKFLKVLTSRDKGKRIATVTIKHQGMQGAHFDLSSPEAETNLRKFITANVDRPDVNMYFTLNGVKRLNSGKHNVPADNDIAMLRGVAIDLDLHKVEPMSDDAYVSLRTRLKEERCIDVLTATLEPSYIIDTGNGAQAFWLLKEPVEASEENAAKWVDIVQRLTQRFIGDMATAHAIKQLYRLPGTINNPDTQKSPHKRRGYTGVWWRKDVAYTLDELQAWAEKFPAYERAQRESTGRAADIGLTDAEILAVWQSPEDLPEHLKQYVGYRPLEDTSRSDFNFVKALYARGLKQSDIGLLLAACYTKKDLHNRSTSAQISYIVGTVQNAKGKTAEDYYERGPGEAEEPGAVPPEEPRTYKSRRFDDLLGDDLEADMLVEDLLTTTGLTMIYGASNTGKSLVAAHLAMTIASGMQFNGRQTYGQGVCVIVAMEGAGGYAKRVHAALRHYPEIKADHLFLIPEEYDLQFNDEKDKSGNTTSGLLAELKNIETESGRSISMVVIDTLSVASAGSDENSSGDMKRLMRNIRRILSATGGNVLVVHHTGKDERRGARGSTVLRAAMDTEIYVRKEKNKPTGYFEVTKQRDMEIDYRQMHFQILSMTLGEKDGKFIRGPVLSFIQPEERDESAPLLQAIIEFMRENDNAPVPIKTLLDQGFGGLKPGTLRFRIYRLVETGDLIRTGDSPKTMRYALAAKHTHPHYTDEDEMEPDEDDDEPNDPFA